MLLSLHNFTLKVNFRQDLVQKWSQNEISKILPILKNLGGNMGMSIISHECQLNIYQNFHENHTLRLNLKKSLKFNFHDFSQQVPLQRFFGFMK
jgi:hypothetical protein